MIEIIEDSVNSTRNSILNAAVLCFGKYGYKKTSMDDIAKLAELSKQSLYLHFSSKEELFVTSMKKYLDDCLSLAGKRLKDPNSSLSRQLYDAMDAWFGRHMETFSPHSFDIIPAGNRLSETAINKYKLAFKQQLVTTISESSEFVRSENICSPKQIADLLFQFGLTWKEESSKSSFMRKVGLCIAAFLQLEK